MNELKDVKLKNPDEISPQVEALGEPEDTWLTKCSKCLNLCPLDIIRNFFIHILNYSYDILTICISIADVTTDVWVIYNFKVKKRDTFFVIALVVMILAQLSYSVAFMLRFAKDSGASKGKIFLLFLCILPLTPVMSFIFFWLSFEDNCIVQILEYFGFDDDMDIETNKKQAPIVVWIEKKLVKHLGFIMEAMIEALPQSIIQLIAIVYYQDTEIINIVSICISLTSVATKTLVFSVAMYVCLFYTPKTKKKQKTTTKNNKYKPKQRMQNKIPVCNVMLPFLFCWFFSLCFVLLMLFDIFVYINRDFRVFIFNWLSLVCDFFGVFAIVSWVFYNPNNPGEITFLGKIWIGKAVTIWIILCFGLGGPICVGLFVDNLNYKIGTTHARRIRNYGYCGVIRKALPYFLTWFIVWILGSTFAIVFCEIIFFAPFALTQWLIAHERFVGSYRSILAKKVFDFILDNKSLETTKDSGGIGGSGGALMHAWQWQIHTNPDKREKYKYVSSKDEFSFNDRRILNRNKKERIFRLVYSNYCLMTVFKYKRDPKLEEYIKENIENEWKNIGLKELRDNCMAPEKALFYMEYKRQFYKTVAEVKNDWENAKQGDDCSEKFEQGCCMGYFYFLFLGVLPIFLISRLFSMFFPIISIIYLNFDVESIQLLQWLLTIAYGVIIISWCVSFVKCMQFYYWTTHLYPGNKSSSWNGSYDQRGLRYLNLMQKYYDKRNDFIFLDKKRIRVVIEVLGKDIGGLVVSYWPQFNLKELLQDLETEFKDM